MDAADLLEPCGPERGHTVFLDLGETSQVNRKFEFRFVVVLAGHADDPALAASEADMKALNDLGREGWQIAGITPDPLLPHAKLIVSLQREIG